MLYRPFCFLMRDFMRFKMVLVKLYRFLRNISVSKFVEKFEYKCYKYKNEKIFYIVYI